MSRRAVRSDPLGQPPLDVGKGSGELPGVGVEQPTGADRSGPELLSPGRRSRRPGAPGSRGAPATAPTMPVTAATLGCGVTRETTAKTEPPPGRKATVTSAQPAGPARPGGGRGPGHRPARVVVDHQGADDGEEGKRASPTATTR
ncbi:hypothetical protein [Streptomyces sp. RCH5-5]|uniref:hypothetical protein n=1 Tax=Streptomyces TaxID=1883 RepID=UPI003A4E1D14